jgi:hypothetical protein
MQQTKECVQQGRTSCIRYFNTIQHLMLQLLWSWLQQHGILICLYNAAQCTHAEQNFFHHDTDSVAVCETDCQTSCTHAKAELPKYYGKLAVANLLQSLHSILKTNTYLLSQGRCTIVYIWPTNTTQHSTHMINNVETIIWSLCIAANNTVCD